MIPPTGAWRTRAGSVNVSHDALNMCIACRVSRGDKEPGTGAHRDVLAFRWLFA